jgi:hypothetical protein
MKIDCNQKKRHVKKGITDESTKFKENRKFKMQIICILIYSDKVLECLKKI